MWGRRRTAIEENFDCVEWGLEASFANGRESPYRSMGESGISAPINCGLAGQQPQTAAWLAWETVRHAKYTVQSRAVSRVHRLLYPYTDAGVPVRLDPGSYHSKRELSD